MTTEIKTGDPLILVSAKGLDPHRLTDGMKGWANSVTHVPGQGSYVFFLPEDGKEIYVISMDRVVVDEEAKTAGTTLDEKTIHKG